MNMYIGSGDTAALLSGKETQAYQKLWAKFVSNDKPNYNAKASPIDALRTGAILEERYSLTLDDSYFCQVKAVCDRSNVMRSSLDFSQIQEGNIVDFEELKCVFFTDYLEFMEFKDDNDLLVKYIKKEYKNYYNQVQFQLLCTGLSSALNVYVPVYSYLDDENYQRDILESEKLKIRVYRDESVISKIIERAEPFQYVKDHILQESKST